MHTSSIELKGDELITITKQVIKPNSFQCLWNLSAGSTGKTSKCQTQLTCWEAYHRHILLCHVKAQRKKFYCGIQEKCSVENAGRKVFKGIQDVEKHVSSAHIANRLRSIPLDCPAKDCRAVVTVRSVEDHFSADHPDLYGRTITLPSDRLRPLWVIQRPQLEPPPDFPLGPIPAGLVPPVRNTKYDVLPPPPINVKPEQTNSSIDFEDLPTQGRYNADTVGYDHIDEDCVVAEKQSYKHLSVPQAILDPGVFGYRTPPQSMLWKAFSVRLDDREREWRALQMQKNSITNGNANANGDSKEQMDVEMAPGP